MKIPRILLFACGFFALVSITGCTSGGSAPKPMTTDELLSRAQQELESVSTNPYLRSNDASTMLKAAVVDYSAVLQRDGTISKAKFGYCVANTLLAFYDLKQVLPKRCSQPLVDMLTLSSAGRSRATADIDTGWRANDAQSAQMRIVSRILPAMKQILPYFDELENTAGTEDYRLRVYVDGQIRVVRFGVSDMKLFSAFANLVTSLLHLGVAYNLNMPNGTPVVALPIDSNVNGMFDSSEYLIAAPFLNKLYSGSMAGCLQYLRVYAVRLQQGAVLTGHTAGELALINVNDADTRSWLQRISDDAAVLEMASTSQVTTDRFFGDGVPRTLNLPKLVDVTSLRDLLPSFQTDNLGTPGVWPDATFRGVVTPGIPPEFLPITYNDIERAY